MSKIKERVVVVGDLHIPHQDDLALRVFEDFLSDYKPNLLIINGDFIDCETLSRYEKVPDIAKIKDEFAFGRDVLKEWRRIVGKKCKIIYIEGNHEFRYRSYTLGNARALYDPFKVAEELHLRYMDIEWIPVNLAAAKFQHNYIQHNGVFIGHYNKVSKHSGYTAKALVADMGVSLVQGHCHRLGVHHVRTLTGRILTGVESGCLCSLEVSYGGHMNWQHGFTIIEFSDEAHFHNIHIKNYQFSWGGKLYSALK